MNPVLWLAPSFFSDVTWRKQIHLLETICSSARCSQNHHQSQICCEDYSGKTAQSTDSNLYTWQVMSSLPVKLILGQKLARTYYGWYSSLWQSPCSHAKIPLACLPATSKYNILMFQRKNKSCNCQYCDGIVNSKLNQLHKLWTKYGFYYLCDRLYTGQLCVAVS